MKNFNKPIQAVLALSVVFLLSSCSFGQAAQPTATPVDVNAVMTSAAATAFVELTKIAGQASATPLSTSTPTPGPATATQDVALLLLTSTQAVGGQTPGAATPTLFNGLSGTTAIPSLTPIVLAGATSNSPTCFNSKFLADVTIPDGTVLKPGEKFFKVWRFQNTGTCAWDDGFGLTIWAGPSMGGVPIYFSQNDKPVEPGGIVDLGIQMKAPFEPGDYVAHWTMINDAGKTFGADVTVFIKVAK